MKKGIGSRHDLWSFLLRIEPEQKVAFVFSRTEPGPKAAGCLRELILDGVFTADPLILLQLDDVSLRGNWPEGASQTFVVTAGAVFSRSGYPVDLATNVLWKFEGGIGAVDPSPDCPTVEAAFGLVVGGGRAKCRS